MRLPSSVVLLTVLFAACAGGPRRTDQGAILRALDELVARPELAGGRIGVHVLEAPGGRILAEHEAERGFAPASNGKLVTAAVALATLGAEHRFATELWVRGPVEDGVLRGEVRLVGGGDPAFGTKAQFDAIAAALRAHGVQRIVGRVVGDDAWLADEHRGHGWQWDHLDQDFAAPFGGLCCRGNTIAVHVAVDAGACRVRLDPPVGPQPWVDVGIVDAGQPAQLVVRRPLGSDRIEVVGELAADAAPQVVRIAVHEPAPFAAAVLQHELAGRGIAFDELPDVVAVGAPTCLATSPSASFGELLQPLLGSSDNLVAEQLWRGAARHATGAGDTAAAARLTSDVLAGLAVPVAGLVPADGSGLSRRNLIQPRQLTALLSAGWRAPWREPFFAALPLAGVSGTLQKRFREGPAHGRVRAKTGSIARVVCLSGYVPRSNLLAPPLVFSVLLNDFVCSDDEAVAALDAFVQALAAAVRGDD